MMKAVSIWLALTLAMALGIMQVRHMSGLELWSSIKTFGFAALCSTLALLVLFVVVILF
jgi:hypothetical protein